MRAQRFSDIGGYERSVIVSDRFQHGIHKKEVGSTVAPCSAGGGHPLWVDILSFPGRKVVDLDSMVSATIPAQLTVGTTDFGVSTHVLRKSIHRHGNGCTSVELHGDNLMVANVVVTSVDATTVRT